MGTTWITDLTQRRWVITPGEAMAKNTLTKNVGDIVTLAFDFGDQPEILAGATITSVVSMVQNTVSNDTLTITNKTAVGGYKAQGLFTAGLSGTSYTITVTVQLSNGSTLARTGTLQVI